MKHIKHHTKYMVLWVMVSLVLISVYGCRSKKDDNVEAEHTTAAIDAGEPTEENGEEGEFSVKGFKLEDKSIEPVWQFPSGLEGEWSEMEPFINPMGKEDAYDDHYFEEDSYMWLSYVSEEFSLVERYVYGEYHRLSIPFKDDRTETENRQFLFDVQSYIDRIDGTVEGKEVGQTVFQAADEEGNRWWTSVKIEYEKIVVECVKERELKQDEPFVIDTDAEESPVYLASYYDDGLFQVLNIDMDGGYAAVKVDTTTRYDEYERSHTVNLGLEEEVGSHYFVGNMANETGVSIYEISWGDDAPGEIRLSLEGLLELDNPEYGEELGAIKVSAAYVSGVSVTPTNGSDYYITHPEYEMESSQVDLTPDGDYMVYVPAGFWDVHLSIGDESVFAEYSTVGVPVNTGEMTEVRVPYPMAASFRGESGSYNERGVRIGKFSEDVKKNTASFYFTMLDDATEDVPPSIENTSIYEGGQPVEILDIRRVVEPLKVVLLLDSSGSMEGELEGVKSAGKAFIEGLPDDSQIHLVDFDSEVKVFEVGSKQEVVQKLNELTVGGSTALYDALVTGTELVDSDERSAIVLFTDGENDLGGNEVLTKEETFAILEESGLQVLTIGFGEGHDGKTLKQLASVSQGLYYDADDSEALGRYSKRSMNISGIRIWQHISGRFQEATEIHRL